MLHYIEKLWYEISLFADFLFVGSNLEKFQVELFLITWLFPIANRNLYKSIAKKTNKSKEPKSNRESDSNSKNAFSSQYIITRITIFVILIDYKKQETNEAEKIK